MQEQNKVTKALEIFLSTAVFVVLFEVIHSVLIKSGQEVVINDSLVFGLIGNNLAAVIVSIVCLLILGLLSFKKALSNTALVLIFSGAIVNIIDRIIQKGTVDYIRVFFIPVFNLPDLFIVIGLIILVWKVLSLPSGYTIRIKK